MNFSETRQPIGAVLVDGALATTWTDTDRVIVKHVGTKPRLHEVLWPYSASVDFLGIEIPTGASVAAAPRNGRRIVVLGDSITQGFWSSHVARSWPVLLAQKTGREVVNLGYGARMCVPSDGTAAAALEPDTIVYLIGFNEFWQQKTDFGDRYRKTLDNIRARRPGVKIVAVTPTWSSVEKPIPLEAYRQEIRDAVSADVTLVEGPSLTSHDLVAFPDTVHPGDAGAAGIAAGLAGVV